MLDEISTNKNLQLIILFAVIILFVFLLINRNKRKKENFTVNDPPDVPDEITANLKQVSSDRDIFCGVDTSDNIYCKKRGSEMVNVPGKLKQISVNNGVVCGVSSVDEIYCMDNQNFNNPEWRQIPGKLKQVSVNNGRLYGVNSSNQIYYAPDYKNPNFRLINGGLSQVSLGNNNVCGTINNEIWCSDNIENPSWTKASGTLKNISVSGSVMCGTNTSNQIWCSDNGNYDSRNWRQVEGTLNNVEVNAGALIGTNDLNQTWHLGNYNNSNWRQIPLKAQPVPAPAPTPASRIPANWTHDGCWKDTADRGISEIVMESGATLESCIAEAEKRGYNVAGLQYGENGGAGQCFVGKNSNYKKHGSTNNNNCSANWKGGDWENNVFIKNDYELPVPVQVFQQPIQDNVQILQQPVQVQAPETRPAPVAQVEAIQKVKEEPVLPLPQNYAACGNEGDVCNFAFEGDNDIYYGVENTKLVKIPARSVTSGKFTCAQIGHTNDKGYPVLPVYDKISGKKSCYLRK